MMDPLVEALELGRPLTTDQLSEAIRARLTRIVDLEAEVRVLRRLMDSATDAEAVRAERDPPYEAP